MATMQKKSIGRHLPTYNILQTGILNIVIIVVVVVSLACAHDSRTSHIAVHEQHDSK